MRRGKGYALAYGCDTSISEGFADAVVVIDADTTVSPNMLSAFAAYLARGEEALQAEYGVRNPLASWRTRLMVIALTLFHTVRSLGRERLALSCGLRGNGMAFSSALLRRVPPTAASIVEDVEYGLALGLAGTRVAYVHEARVLGDMPTTGSVARSQRERWESGRSTMAREHAIALLREGARRRSLVLLDLAADLLVPPLTMLVAICACGLVLALTLRGTGVASRIDVGLWAVATAAILLYVTRGLVLARLGARGILDLLWAPVYICWKLTVALRPTARRGEWVRTNRSE
jgi:cellulose synthase/poly-beta-1,6-N-acetylglucosamine synthase-like glycosyltransferase